MQLPEIQIEKIPEQIKQAIQLSPKGIAELTDAITKARPNFGVIKKTATNPFYKDAAGKPRKYADLAEIIAATAEPLAEQGLYVFQAPIIEDGKTVGITTLLSHSSGEWLQTSMTGCPADQKLKDSNGNLTISRFDAQTIGIGFTYLARYAMRAILNLGAEDDDGNGLVSPPELKKLPQLKLKKLPQLNRTAAGTTIIVSPETIKIDDKTVATINADSDGCPVSDSDLPEELKLPTSIQITEFAKQLKALNQDSRLLKQWVEAEAGKPWKSIPVSKFEPIIRKLKTAEQNGTLLELITPKEVK